MKFTFKWPEKNVYVCYLFETTSVRAKGQNINQQIQVKNI